MCKAVNSYQLAQKDVQNHQEPKLNQLKVIHPSNLCMCFHMCVVLMLCFGEIYEYMAMHILILPFSFMKLDTNELRRRMKEIEEAHIADITSEQTASVEILAKIRSNLH